MKAKFFAFTIFLIYTYIIPTKTELEVNGTQGIRLWCDTVDKAEYVKTYQYKSGFDFLKFTYNTSTPIEVLVSKDQLISFKSNLSKNNIKYEVVVQDMKQLIEEELNDVSYKRRKRSQNILSTFPRYDEIKQYLENLAKSHSDIMKYYRIGKSFENRDIMVVQISSGEKKKKALLIDAGIHAREWIAPTTALYAIKEFVTNPDNKRLFENVDIYIIPLLNPDGYEFSHSGAQARIWRKTRSVQTGTDCVGVDANRNFGFKWNVVGSSNDPCDMTYAGPRAFSEPEAMVLRDFFFLKKNIKAYLSLHSYGNLLVYPWGYTTEKPPNYRALKCVAKKAVEQLFEIRGTYYEYGTASEAVYPCSGSSQDWALQEGGAKIAYSMELPSKAFHFAPPTYMIEPIGKETFEAIKVFVDYVDGKICNSIFS